jgi:hypothetical protein
MEDAEHRIPPEEPETAPGEPLEGSRTERTHEASRHADRKARQDEAAHASPDEDES